MRTMTLNKSKNCQTMKKANKKRKIRKMKKLIKIFLSKREKQKRPMLSKSHNKLNF